MAYYHLGDVTLVAGKSDMAAGFYQKVLQIEPGHQGARAKLEAIVRKAQELKVQQSLAAPA